MIAAIRRPSGVMVMRSPGTSWPARVNCCAAARPDGPEPTTATRRPVRVEGGIGLTRSAAPSSCAAVGSQPPSCSQALLAKM